jgi:tetratricopeptide (TPR) repeat protein
MEARLASRRLELPHDHPEIQASMSSLASMYSDLGRHEDALKLSEEVLEFRRRVLPSDHPDIATSMSSLAWTYSALGQHKDALKMSEEELEFQRRVLPSDHPDIAMSMSNLAWTYSALGLHKDALKMSEVVLEFRRRVLPSDHPHIATSMDNLASTYSALGRHTDALKLQEDALEFRRRVLPSDHPDSATSENSKLASMPPDRGRLKDAQPQTFGDSFMDSRGAPEGKIGTKAMELRSVCDLVFSRADSVPVQIFRNKLMFTGEGRYGTALCSRKIFSYFSKHKHIPSQDLLANRCLCLRRSL